MQKRKLFLITENFPFGRGEAPFILPELPHLCENFDVTIVYKNTEDVITSEIDEDINVHRFSLVRGKKLLLKFPRLLFMRDFYREISRIIKSKKSILGCIADSALTMTYANGFFSFLKSNGIFENVDESTIFYSYWNNYGAYALVKNQKILKGATVISRMHGFDLYNERNAHGRQPLKEIAHKRLEKCIFACEFAKDYYVNNFTNGSEEKCEVAYLGTQRNDRTERSQDGVFRLFSCSNVIPLKRVDMIVRALKEIDAIEIEWTHAGDGESLQEVREIAKNLIDGKQNVTYNFLGYTDNSEIKKWYSEKNVDCFISLSETEGGVPVSIMEACAAGIPVISTDVGGCAEIVSEKTGVLIRKDFDAREVASQITRMATMEACETKVKSDASIEIWNRKFNTEKNCAEFAERLLKI